jgi:hypothetical protein
MPKIPTRFTIVRRALILATKAALSMKVIPDGADKPLPPLPAMVEIDPEDTSEIALWDRLMPEYKGLLNAKIEKKRRYES